MKGGNDGQVDVILKSIKLKKEYSLEANRSNKLSDIAFYLKSLPDMKEFVNEELIIFKESEKSSPIPPCMTVGELIKGNGKNLDLFVEITTKDSGITKVKSDPCCLLF